MQTTDLHNRIVRFGTFEVDLRAREVRRSGLKVRLQDQPFQVLAMLLERPGELVTREEIQTKLWPSNTFVDFDLALNAAVRKLRQALNDDAGTPRYIETLPRRGYRFVYPVETDKGLVPALVPGDGEPAQERPRGVPRRGHRMNAVAWAVAVGAAVVIFAVLTALNVAGLRDRILGAGVARAPGHPQGATVPKIESIAVLPLQNLSHDPEQEYFADGMTDALTAELATIGALRVISRTSAMEYKGTKKHLTEIARELNVDAVVEGSVMRSANRVRITAQLIHAATDRHLWAENYERDLGDVVTLQGEVTRAIVREVQVKVTPLEEARLASARPVNPEAHELYLKGRFYCSNELSADRVKRGLGYFQQAVGKDPNDALAYAGMADCYVVLAVTDIAPPREVVPQAKQAVAKALALDESLSEAHASLAMVKFLYDHDWSAAEKEFQRAIALNPSYASRAVGYPFYLLAMSRKEEAIAEMKRTYALDPVAYLTNAAFSWFLLYSHQYDQAIEQHRKMVEMFPDSANCLAEVYEQKGLFPEALDEYQRAERFPGASVKWAAALRQGYMKAGAKGYWQSKLQLLRVQSKQVYVPPYYFAVIYASLGDRDRALEWLEKEYDEGHDGVVYLKIDPHFDGLRSAPRFQDLVRRMNFPP